MIGVLLLEEAVSFFLSQTNELGFLERDFVRIEREQGFAGTILESRDDFR